MSVIHWFRRDLRLQDNTALHAALRSGQQVVPVFILDETLLHSPRVGAPRVAFLFKALTSLDVSLRRYGTRLLIRRGRPKDALSALVNELEAQAVYCNADYSPYARSRDKSVEDRLTVPLHMFDDAVLIPPDQLFNKQGKPYTVFTPYRKTWDTRPKVAPSTLTLQSDMFHPLNGIDGEAVPTAESLGFDTFIVLPEASETAAVALLEAFVAEDLPSYATTRNTLVINPFETPRPQGSSYLSPYLRLGLLSPRQAYQRARKVYDTASQSEHASIDAWIHELAWRDFYMQVLYHFPHVLERDFKPQYEALAWENDPALLRAWQEGRTGYPIIDAPMRQLNAIGWMPNRARMIVASFLTKDLLVHWKHGDLYFMQRLIDGDPAANNGGWQWAAGTGTDAQPFFRIFNPVTQSRQFATSDYLRHWLPELRSVSDHHIHTPWTMKEPPRAYPAPIVNHTEAREHALTIMRQLRKASTETTSD